MTSTPSLGDLACFARELAACARHETLALFGAEPSVENKASHGRFDPVTEADRAAEAAMRDRIEKRFPDHGVRGEEFADKVAASPFSWSLDPIDGTRSYMCGLPTWTTLIGLLQDEEPILGLIDAPCLDETYIAFEGTAILAAKGGQRPIRTSGCNRLTEARFSTTDPLLMGPDIDLTKRIAEAVRVTRYGHDGYAYALLAAGSIDLVIETGLKPYDYNALIPVVRAAGGHFGDWSGGAAFDDGDVIAAASRELYEAAAELLAAP